MKTIKRLLILSLILPGVLSVSNAQDKKMSIGIGFGSTTLIYEFPSIDYDPFYSTNPGLNVYTNFLYNFNPRLAAGFEYNLTLPLNIYEGDSREGINYISGYLAKLKYSFADEGVRIYIAFLTGVYRNKRTFYDYYNNPNPYSNYTINYESGFGIGSQFGVRFNTFQINSSIHFPGILNSSTYNLSALMLQISIGWNIGVFIKE